MLEEECHRNFAFTMYHAGEMPLLEWGRVEVKRLGEWYGQPGTKFGCQVASEEGRNRVVSSGNVPEAR